MAIITLDGFCDSPLWNSSLSWGTTNDSWPEFTQCFQLAVLVWIPCGWLWLTLPFYVYYLINNVDKWRPLTVFSITKTVVSVMLTGLVLGDLATDTYRSSHLTVVYEAVILQAITYILSALLMQTERLRGIVTSGVLFIFWLLCTITGIIPFYSKIILKEYERMPFTLDFFMLSMLSYFYSWSFTASQNLCLKKNLLQERDHLLNWMLHFLPVYGIFG